MSDRVSSAEIIEAVGFSQKTLRRWSSKGYLPKPEVGPHPSGRGKMGFYPSEALAIARRIIVLRGQGHSLPKAAEQAKRELEPKGPTGRSWSLNSAVVQEVCAGVRVGLSYRDAAARAGITERTFHNWVRQAQEPDAPTRLLHFFQQLEVALLDLKATCLARIHTASKEGSWQAATWILARKFPREFGLSVEHNAKVKHSGKIRTTPRKVVLELVAPDGSSKTVEREPEEEGT